MTTRVLTGLLLAAVAGCALVARWQWAATAEGRQLQPRPDAIEYVASAQALAQHGRFFLQVGPVEAPPRYAPGWSLVLAAGLRSGVAPTELWRLAGIGGAGMAALLAFVTWALLRTRRVLETSRSGADSAAVGAVAAVAGLAWALAPVAVAAGRTVLADEPTAFAAILSVAAALAAIAYVATLAPRMRTGLACLSGLAAGAVVAIRPVEGALLAIPLSILGAGAIWRRHSEPELPLGRLALAWLAGAAVFVLAATAVSVRSGRAAWAWSDYAVWAPAGARYFDPRFALGGNPELASDGYPAQPYLLLAAAELLGLPVVPVSWTGGWLWPAAGWICALMLWRRWLRDARRSAQARGFAWIAGAAIGAWVLARVALFSSYFYPAPRFYLPALAVPAVALAVACGLATRSPRRSRRAAGWAGLAAWLLLSVVSFRGLRAEPTELRRGELGEARRQVAAWLALSDTQRVGATVEFDPVLAQALGLLPPAALATIDAWGPLPRTYHIVRLRRRGLLPPPAEQAPRRSPEG